MPLNNAVVGKIYPPQSHHVTPEASVAYAKAYNEKNPKLLTGESIPPMFGVVYTWTALGQTFFDPETGIQPEDIMRLLHGEEDLYFVKPVHPGDNIRTTAFIKEVNARCNGESMVVGLSSENQSGETVQIAFATLFFRKKGKEPFSPPKAETNSGNLILERAQESDRDQSLRYAQASGDHNPLHTDETTAQMAGLPGIILHGLCTMAFASSIFINEFCQGEPSRLKRLKARFAKPVFPGQRMTTRIEEPRINSMNYLSYDYHTLNPEGQAVLSQGVAWVSES